MLILIAGPHGSDTDDPARMATNLHQLEVARGHCYGGFSWRRNQRTHAFMPLGNALCNRTTSLPLSDAHTR